MLQLLSLFTLALAQVNNVCSACPKNNIRINSACFCDAEADKLRTCLPSDWPFTKLPAGQTPGQLATSCVGSTGAKPVSAATSDPCGCPKNYIKFNNTCYCDGEADKLNACLPTEWPNVITKPGGKTLSQLENDCVASTGAKPKGSSTEPPTSTAGTAQPVATSTSKTSSAVYNSAYGMPAVDAAIALIAVLLA